MISITYFQLEVLQHKVKFIFVDIPRTIFIKHFKSINWRQQRVGSKPDRVPVVRVAGEQRDPKFFKVDLPTVINLRGASRFGPNGLKLEKETTHFIVRWTRVASMA